MMNTTKAPHPIKRFYSTISKRHSFPARQSSPLIISTATSPLRPRRHVSITTTTTEIIDPPIQDDTVTAFWDYQFLFASQRNEALESIVLRVVDGAIPSDFPSGTYYLTGPGIFSDDYGSTVHPLDGHGYLRTFSLDGSTGEVRFSARYVETEAQKEERDGETGRWRFTHRGPFSVLRGGKKVGNTKVMKNVANTSVVEWGGRLLCLWEGGDPYEVEAETLDTVGRFEVWIKSGGHLEEEEEEKKGGGGGGIWDFAARMLRPILFGVFKMPPKRLLSHYKIDPKRNRLLLVSCNAEDMLLPRSIFTFHEFDLNFNLIQKQDFVIPDHIMIHDWAFTDSHYILFGNRIKLDVPGSMLALFGLSPMISALTVNPSKTTSPIYVLPRDPMNTINGHRDWNVPIEAPEQMWVLHTANAFEQIDERGNLKVQIHAVACSYQWFNFHKMFGYNWRSGKLDPSFMNEGEGEGEEELLPHLVKVSINFGVDGIFDKCSVDTLEHWRRASDFPTINPSISGSKNNFIYVATSSGSNLSLPHFPFNSVAKVDINGRSISLWSARNRGFIGESIFVPKGDKEDDGYILTIEYAVSIKRCYLLVLNPKRMGEADALVARLEVPKSLSFPMGFHGYWAVNK